MEWIATTPCGVLQFVCTLNIFKVNRRNEFGQAGIELLDNSMPLGDRRSQCLENIPLLYHYGITVALATLAKAKGIATGSAVKGCLKKKSAMMVFEQHANLKYNFGNRYFLATEYYVITVCIQEKALWKAGKLGLDRG